jgi:hypothetical protein
VGARPVVEAASCVVVRENRLTCITTRRSARSDCNRMSDVMKKSTDIIEDIYGDCGVTPPADT